MLSRFLKRKPQLTDRDGERYDVALRVLSRELPGYRGVTIDLSRSGVQLETSGLLEIGSTPTLKLEFDRGQLDSFECKARVVWSRKDEDSVRKFYSGLTFEPENDDERRQLARMATVLQARSETDLDTLLDQALRIDPELEESYARFSENPPRQTEAPAARPAAPRAEARPPQHPGIYIPLSVILEGYTWNRASKTLHLGIRESGVVHSLYFPDCQLFQVMEPMNDEVIIGLYSTTTSPAIRRVVTPERQVDYRHYRFVANGGKGLIDIVSGAVRHRYEE